MNRVQEKQLQNSNTGFWIGILAITLGGIVSTGIIYIRKKKDDDEA